MFLDINAPMSKETTISGHHASVTAEQSHFTSEGLLIIPFPSEDKSHVSGCDGFFVQCERSFKEQAGAEVGKRSNLYCISLLS